MRPPAALSAALLVAVVAALPAGCGRRDEPVSPAATARPAPAAVRAADDWRTLVTPADASTLGRLDQAWRLARAEAEAAGFARQVEGLGPLVDPYAGLAGDVPPAPGDYRCRTLRLGARAAGDPAHAETAWGRCAVALTPDGELWLTADTGFGRSRGRLYPDTGRRLVFLGARAGEADGADAPAYGDQRARDRIGVFERIGPARWRLVIPWPRQAAKLEIVELAD
ncbi:MAG: DUF4893 domain-containing protein [Brevundimonas sp.]|nr:DUF4893 domain-containing protein [Brevundimonas sp.]